LAKVAYIGLKTLSEGSLSAAAEENKNSSGDEIANVNFYAVRLGNYQNSLK